MGDRVPFRRPRAVIFDLDGLLVDTESLCREVAQQICEEHGRTLTPEVHAQCVGLRPVESWRSLAERLQIPMTGEVLYEQTEATLYDRFTEAKTLPGSARLVHHLKAAGIPLGLATSSSRRGAERKLAGRGLLEAFDAVGEDRRLPCSGNRIRINNAVWHSPTSSLRLDTQCAETTCRSPSRPRTCISLARRPSASILETPSPLRTRRAG